MLKVVKSVGNLSPMRKGSTMVESFFGADRVSVVCSSKGRRSVIIINDSENHMSSEAFSCFEFDANEVSINVVSGYLYVDKITFFKKHSENSSIYDSTPDHFIFGIIV